MKARICRSAQRTFDCRLDDGTLVAATALGKLLKGKDTLVVGDWVSLEKNTEDEFIITDREERNNEIFRVIIRENKKKITAANVDVLVILSSASRPAYKRGIVDRFLVRAAQWNVTPLVVFNKMDEYSAEQAGWDITFNNL